RLDAEPPVDVVSDPQTVRADVAHVDAAGEDRVRAGIEAPAEVAAAEDRHLGRAAPVLREGRSGEEHGERGERHEPRDLHGVLQRPQSWIGECPREGWKQKEFLRGRTRTDYDGKSVGAMVETTRTSVRTIITAQ